jgi:hypothetical protein
MSSEAGGFDPIATQQLRVKLRSLSLSDRLILQLRLFEAANKLPAGDAVGKHVL